MAVILTGSEIHREVLAGRIHIDDFDPARLEPNSYGFRLAPQILVYDDDIIDCYEPPAVRSSTIGAGGMVLEPGRFYLGATMEAMGSPDHAATLYACRSVATLGMWIQFSAPLGHAGAVIPWTLEIHVAVPIRVFAGMVIGKLAFWETRGAPTRYRGRYTGSTSAVPSRLSVDAPDEDLAMSEAVSVSDHRQLVAPHVNGHAGPLSGAGEPGPLDEFRARPGEARGAGHLEHGRQNGGAVAVADHGAHRHRGRHRQGGESLVLSSMSGVREVARHDHRARLGVEPRDRGDSAPGRRDRRAVDPEVQVAVLGDDLEAACLDDERPLLILISPGERGYREYLFASVCSSYRIHLITSHAVTWEADYVVGATVLAGLELAAVLEVAHKLAAEHVVAGVLSWDEARIELCAHVAAALGLPGGQPDVIRRVRDKHETRTVLDARGIRQPTSLLVAEVEEGLAAAERIGYPVVLKPRAAAASFGVVLVADPGELEAHFAFARTATVPDAPSYEAAVLVERYLDAPEISIDAVVQEGQVHPLFVAHKELGYAPCFEEVGHFLDGADPLLRDRNVLGVLQDAHAALGYVEGWTHTELKLTPEGAAVIEVNGRLGGDLIPYLGQAATGVDPGLVAATVACGLRPELTATRALVAGVRFLYLEHEDDRDLVVESVTFARDALHPALDLTVALVAPGTVVPAPNGIPPERIAVATAVAATAAECRAALDSASAALRVSSKPSDAR